MHVFVHGKVFQACYSLSRYNSQQKHGPALCGELGGIQEHLCANWYQKTIISSVLKLIKINTVFGKILNIKFKLQNLLSNI